MRRTSSKNTRECGIVIPNLCLSDGFDVMLALRVGSAVSVRVEEMSDSGDKIVFSLARDGERDSHKDPLDDLPVDEWLQAIVQRVDKNLGLYVRPAGTDIICE